MWQIPIWMYEKMDSTNDGLMNAQDMENRYAKEGLLGFDAPHTGPLKMP